MRTRFLVAAAHGPDTLEAIEASVGRSLPGTQMKAALRQDHCLVLATEAAPLTTNGVLLGECFIRGSAGALGSLSEADQNAAAATRGAWLMNACWGGYVALVADSNSSAVDIVRAPLGDLACYLVREKEVLLCASDVGLLIASGRFTPRIDAAALVRHLAADDIRRPETCLAGLTELPGGHRLTVDPSGMAEAPLWSPWTFAGQSRQIADKEDAVRRVRDAAQYCVAARSTAGPVLLKLSGGLDSSVVAACLRRAGRDFSCLTLVTQDPAGDERKHARNVAEALGVTLVECYRDPRFVDIGRSEARRLPRPTARSFTQESTRLASGASLEAAARAIFDGGGGDNVFCSLQSARPATDCLLGEAGHGQFWPTARTIAQLAQAPVWKVAWRAWATARRRRPDYRWPVDTRFFSSEARETAAGATAHPWLCSPDGALPGKAAHVALIAAAQSVAEGFDAEDDLTVCSPLISQPLVEVCLQVPTWLWFEGGLNRATARKAFEGSLPEAIVGRRSKGAPDGFVAEIYELNRREIRTMLMEGWLRRQGLLDLHALAARTDDPPPVRGHDYLRIMQLVDAEAWARCWS